MLHLAKCAIAADLVERLVGAAAVGVNDLRPAATRDREHAVAFRVFDDQPGQQVRDTGAVARHADAEPAREPRVCAGHVRGAGFVPRRDDLDAELVQARVEPEVGAVDDAEDLLDAFGLQHAREHFAATRLRCMVLPPVASRVVGVAFSVEYTRAEEAGASG